MYGILGNGVYTRGWRVEAEIELQGLRKHALEGRGIRRSITSIR